jgi:hypothetical protein
MSFPNGFPHGTTSTGISYLWLYHYKMDQIRAYDELTQAEAYKRKLLTLSGFQPKIDIFRYPHRLFSYSSSTYPVLCKCPAAVVAIAGVMATWPRSWASLCSWIGRA